MYKTNKQHVNEQHVKIDRENSQNAIISIRVVLKHATVHL